MTPNISKDNQEQVEQMVSSLQGNFRVRSFETTTEGIIFLKKVMPLVGSLQSGFDELKDEDISKLFDIFPPETIKYIVSNFVEVRVEDTETFEAVDYEEEFKGDFETLLAVFMMALMKLVEEVQPKGKSQGKIQKKIKPKKRK